MAERSLKLLIAGDAAGALRALGQTGDAADGIGTKFAKFGKVAAAGFAAAGVAAVAFGKSAVEAAAESQKISKITEQLVKTTGGAAKISAEQVGELATALSNKTAIDDEAIQSASNLILTFKNVRNEAGKGNDIFNRATAAALDLSTVMGTDASGAAMQLAKALDNPLKGVTALQRSGVSFTAQQKEQIKTLVASGKTLEAQKIILKEVESQVGGAAAASATSAERAKIAFGNLQEQIGGYLLPVVEKVSNFLVTTFIPKLAELADKYGPAIGAAFTRMGEVMKVVWGWLQVNVPPAMEAVRTVVQTYLEAIRAFWDRWGAGITAVATVWFNAVKGQIEGIMTQVRGIINIILGLIDGDWQRVWNGIKTFVSGLGQQLGAIIEGWAGLLKIAMKVAFEALKDGAILGWQLTVAWIKLLPSAIKLLLFDLPQKMAEIGRDIIGGIWQGIKDKGKEFAGNLRRWIDDHIPKAVQLLMGIRSPSTVMAEIGGYIGDGLIVGMTGRSRAVTEAASAMVAGITGPMAGEAARNGGAQLASIVITSMAGEAARNGHMAAVPLFTSMAGEAARNGGKQVSDSLFGSMAGEAARTGYKTISEPLYAAMAGEAARNGATVYTPLAGAMAGEAARNGTKVAKPLFAAMAGEAARNGAQQIAGALRTHLEVEARNLGYDLGKTMSEEITGSLEDVIGKMTQRINQNIGGGFGGGGGMGGGQVFAGGPGGGPTGGGPIDVGGLYGGFTGTMGDWARNQLKELADWNQKWNPEGSPQVRVFAPNPITGGTLTDAAGNGVYLDDPNAVREALARLVPQMAAGGVVSSPTLAMIGEAGPEAIVPLNRAGGYGMGDVVVNVTGSVISERDLVESIRKALIVDQQRGKILIPTY